MLIDTHAHLNFNAFKQDADEIIAQCLKNNIWMINVGSQYETSKRAVELARKYEKGVYAAIGLHPIHTISSRLDPNEVNPGFKSTPRIFDKEKYLALAKAKKVVAVGEIGLDYFYANSDEDKEKQKQAFIQQIKLAQELKLPIIIHCRDAWQDLIKILKNYYSQGSDSNTNLSTGVAHFFSGSSNDAKEILDMGFLISFTGVISFTHAYDAIIEKTPLEKLMVETDCPYVAPVPFRGKRNLPLYVKYIAQRIAEIKNMNLEKISEITTKNAVNLFNLS